MLKNILIRNRYFDSATLMLLTNKVRTQLDLSTEEVAIMMATEMNKRIMRDSGLLDVAGEAANPGDVLIAIKTDLEEVVVLKLVERVLAQKGQKKPTKEEPVSSVNEALERYPDSNFAVVSVPGLYAAREVRKLLNANKHVLLFSDNISIEDEVALKDLAISKDLLLMGPDCGTAIIHGVGLGFSNKVKKGRIGVVAASGTGLQEVVSLVSNHGSGISHAFGTGGRDVKDAVGGRMMFYCLDLLVKDENTDVIVLVSKPPQEKVLKKLVARLENVRKPVVACFLGAKKELFEGTSVHYAKTLEDAAYEALRLQGKVVPNEFPVAHLAASIALKNPSGDVRAIYCGGTLAYEALLTLEEHGLEVYSNLTKHSEYKLGAKDKSCKNVVLDMGDDEFTVGKPHPMIDPSGRSARLRKEAEDSSVSVIIADVELGYGSNDQAADQLAGDFAYIREIRPDIVCIGVICGSKDDYQGYTQKKAMLEAAGAIVPPGNSQALKLALALLKK